MGIIRVSREEELEQKLARLNQEKSEWIKRQDALRTKFYKQMQDAKNDRKLKLLEQMLGSGISVQYAKQAIELYEQELNKVYKNNG